MEPSQRQSAAEPHLLREAFLKWQCRVRCAAMRDNEGQPDAAIMPAVHVPEGETYRIIIILNKSPDCSVTPELEYMNARTNDPAQRREQAVRFLAASYYQDATEFSDILTATFPPHSQGAGAILAAAKVRLVFDAFAQHFDLSCKARRLGPDDPFRRATVAHNRLFNPALSAETEVLAFEPDWSRSVADPMPAGVGSIPAAGRKANDDIRRQAGYGLVKTCRDWFRRWRSRNREPELHRDSGFVIAVDGQTYISPVERNRADTRSS